MVASKSCSRGRTTLARDDFLEEERREPGQGVGGSCGGHGWAPDMAVESNLAVRHLGSTTELRKMTPREQK
jgi:hypothetical protein